MPFAESDAELFFGRDQDIELISNNALAYRVSVLYGPSGVGKSSVLQAGVLRQIRKENQERRDLDYPIETVVAYTNDWRDDPQALLARVVKDAFLETLGSAPETAERLDVDAIIRFCEEYEGEEKQEEFEGEEQRGVDLLLILDQFEELFLYHREDIPTFAEKLAGLLRPDARVNILISIREDAWARLDQFEEAIPRIFDRTLRLEHLDEASARSAIVEPLKHHNERAGPEARREIEPALVDALIDQVQTGRVRVDDTSGSSGSADSIGRQPSGEIRVEAPFLQLVLKRLWDEETQRGSPLMRLETLHDLGGAEKIVRQHLDRVVHQFDANELRVMADAFRHLVTASGSKIAHTAGDLADETSHDPEVMRSVLHRLCSGEQRILREVPGPLDQADAEPRFEIFHDVLARAVLDWRRRWLADMAKEEAEVQTREAHRRLRRARLVISGLGLLVVACLVLAYTAKIKSDEASRNNALDEVNQLLDSDPSAALAKALKSWDSGSSTEYEDAFRKALDAADTEVLLKLGSPVVASFFVGRNDLVTVTEDGFVRSWRGGTSRNGLTLKKRSAAEVTLVDSGDRVKSAVLAGDQDYVVVSTYAGNVFTVKVATGAVRELVTDADQEVLLEAPREGAGNLVLVFEPYGDVAGVYDVTAPDRPIELQGFDEKIWGGALDRTGDYLATFAMDSTVRVWELSTRRLAKSAKVSSASGDAVEYIRGELTGAADRPHLVLIADTPNSEFHQWDVLRDRNPAFFDHADAYVYGFDASGERKLVFAADNSGQVYHHPYDGDADVEGYQGTLSDQRDEVTTVRFDPGDDHMVALGSDSGQIELHDTHAFEGYQHQFPLTTYRGHGGPIASLAFAPGGGRMVTGSRDGTVRVWRPPARKVMWRSGSLIVNAKYTPDGRYLIGSDSSGKIVRIDDGGSSTEVSDPPDGTKLDPSPSGSAAVVVPFGLPDTPRVVTFDDSKPQALTRIDTATDDYLKIVRWNPDTGHPQVAGGTWYNHLVFWNPGSGAIEKTVSLGDEQFEVRDLKYSRDGSHVVAISNNGAVRVVSAEDGRIEQRWTAPRSSSVDISSDGRFVITAGDDDQRVRVWNVKTAKDDGPLYELIQPRGRGFITSVALSNDDGSKRVAAATAEGLIYVWDRPSGKLLAILKSHADFIDDVEFNPKDTKIDLLVSGSDDSTIASYECTTCRLSSDELEDAARAKMAQVIDVRKK